MTIVIFKVIVLDRDRIGAK